MGHRDPGVVAAVLNDHRVLAELIADGIHVAPEMVSLFLRLKGPEAAVLVSDATSATGMGDGKYRLGPIEVEVQGQTCRSAEGGLAGSVLTLDRAIRNIMAFAHWELGDAVRLATLNPARLLEGKLEGKEEMQRGVLSPGARADIAVLTAAGEVVQTIVRGRV